MTAGSPGSETRREGERAEEWGNFLSAVSLRRATILLAVLACGLAVAGGGRAATLPAGFAETTVWSGLTNPTAVRFAADGRIFVAEKSGRINVFDGLTDTTPTLFADLSTNVYNYWDRGLVGLALHPGFPATPYVYVLYTHDAAIGGAAPRWGTPGVLSDPCPSPPGPTTGGCIASARLSRLEAAGNVMTGSERVLIEDWCQQYPSHTVGTVAFGADGALYVSGGDAASFTFADYGQAGSPPNMCGDPVREGGSLRAQDLRTGGDPLGLDGTLLRLDPETGAGLPDNPLAFSADPNERRLIAHGFRNPFRFAFRPGTSEVWLGDVGWDTVEELNQIPASAGAVLNFGWPCYEGTGRQPGYDAADLGICESLYAAGPSAVRSPYFGYRHDEKVVAGESCPTGGSSVSGVAFRGAGAYPAAYDGALFLADYTRRCIWALPRGADGLPDPAARLTFVADAAGPVDLQAGPGGDLFYADFDGGTIRRITYGAPGPEDKALGRPATASSFEKAGLEATRGNDGSSTTRWSSIFADDQWWQVDLGSPRNIDRVTINWEIAHASRYQILTSQNGTSFTLAAEQTLTAPGPQTTSFTTRNARYLRIHCNTRATSYGCSFWDANVHGPADGAPTDTTPPTAAVTAPPNGATVGGTVTATATATDDTAVAGVQFKLDGANLGPEDTTAPYATPWNTTATTNGAHTLTATARDTSGNTATSAPVGVTVANSGPEDKALGRPATASSFEKAGLEATRGNDGSSTTRWSSIFADDQWWQVDLGSPRNIDRVTINWEIAHASRYQILTSQNGTSFTLAAEQTLTAPGPQTTSFTTRNARYLRIHCNTRATSYGCSFWDANVYGPSDTTPPREHAAGRDAAVAAVDADVGGRRHDRLLGNGDGRRGRDAARLRVLLVAARPALPFDLPLARGADVRGSQKRDSLGARPRLPVPSRAAADGDRRRWALRRRDGRAAAADCHAELHLLPVRPPARRRLARPDDAVHPHGDRRLEHVDRGAVPADARRPDVRLRLLVRRRRSEPQRDRAAGGRDLPRPLRGGGGPGSAGGRLRFRRDGRDDDRGRRHLREHRHALGRVSDERG